MWQNRGNFGEQLSVATFGHSFWGPLCRIALGSRFGEQSSFREPIWRMSLGSSRFGATALQRRFGEQLWEAASGNCLGSIFGKLSGTTLRNNCFEEQQLWGAAFGGGFANNFVSQKHPERTTVMRREVKKALGKTRGTSKERKGR